MIYSPEEMVANKPYRIIYATSGKMAKEEILTFTGMTRSCYRYCNSILTFNFKKELTNAEIKLTASEILHVSAIKTPPARFKVGDIVAAALGCQYKGIKGGSIFEIVEQLSPNIFYVKRTNSDICHKVNINSFIPIDEFISSLLPKYSDEDAFGGDPFF